MGNSSSAPAATAAADEIDLGSHTSGIFLGEDLQEHVITDFKNELLQQQWTSHQAALLDMANERTKTANERRSRLQHDLDQWKEQDKLRQSNLDAAIDGAEARFADLGVAIGHDASRLERALVSVGGGKKTNSAHPCNKERANLVACYKESAGVSHCDGVLQALERCATKTIVQNVAKQ